MGITSLVWREIARQLRNIVLLRPMASLNLQHDPTLASTLKMIIFMVIKIKS
jgi:hypothetical protein